MTAKQKAKKVKAERARRAKKKAAAATEALATDDDASVDSSGDTPDDATPSAAQRRRPRWSGLGTLDEWNAERKTRWGHPSPSDDEPNGIACPHCGEETLDRSPGKMLDGSPPRMEIHCNSECGFVGRRIA